MTLREYRIKRKMTQSELAEAVGVTQAYIHALETGKRQNPSLRVLMSIAKALKVSPSKLLNEKEAV